MEPELDDEQRATGWQRVGAACGIAAVLALVAATLIVPQPPKADASTGKILAYYIDHRHSLLFAQWLTGLGTALFLWFVGSLRGAWAQEPGSASELSAVAFGGGVVLAAGALAGTGLNLTLVYLARSVQNTTDLVRALYIGQALTLTLIFFAAAVFLAGGGLLVRRLGATWLGGFGVLLAVFDLLAAGAISDFKGVRSPTGPLPLAAFAGFLLWVFATCVIILTRLGRGEDEEIDEILEEEDAEAAPTLPTVPAESPSD
ncbi:MAG: hypothetical protein JO176_11800 [Acidimicrobiia bacterium]|nr:hypothetical protein [Acidimicrobiia bacterium]